MRERAPLLDVRQLTAQLRLKEGVVCAADDVTFSIAEGEVLGLVGESGSGKSVTAMSIMRLLDDGWRTGGAVLLGGQDLLAMTEREMLDVRGKRIGMIFQDPATSLDPVATVGAQVVEALDHRYYDAWRGGLLTGVWRLLHRWGGLDRTAVRAQRARAVELLRAVHLPNPDARFNDYPYMLSGGMIQRIMIAIALAGRPQLLIADEPTTALDVTIQAQILDLLRARRQDSNLAVLLITHDLGVVAETCDRVAVMYAGRVVEEAPTRQLFAQPRHPYTVGLLRSMPDPDLRVERLTAIEGTVPALVDLPPNECHFAARCPAAMDACRQARPVPVQVDAAHTVACHLYPANEARTGLTDEPSGTPVRQTTANAA
jgi:oligopeptide/dipeptide ABC transporter ATP-binding protein